MSSDEIIIFKDSIPIDIFAPNGGHCVYYPSNIFFAIRAVLKIWGYHPDSPQFS